jgi:hypothetical protein
VMDRAPNGARFFTCVGIGVNVRHEPSARSPRRSRLVSNSRGAAGFALLSRGSPSRHSMRASAFAFSRYTTKSQTEAGASA